MPSRATNTGPFVVLEAPVGRTPLAFTLVRSAWASWPWSTGQSAAQLNAGSDNYCYSRPNYALDSEGCHGGCSLSAPVSTPHIGLVSRLPRHGTD